MQTADSSVCLLALQGHLSNAIELGIERQAHASSSLRGRDCGYARAGLWKADGNALPGKAVDGNVKATNLSVHSD